MRIQGKQIKLHITRRSGVDQGGKSLLRYLSGNYDAAVKVEFVRAYPAVRKNFRTVPLSPQLQQHFPTPESVLL